jgi:hypothetical protein
MNASLLFQKYISAIRAPEISCTDERLLMDREGVLSMYYAPFDWVNADARIVLVGITPGRTQAANALTEARKALAESLSPSDALARAKRAAAFSGAMRSNLIAMLDRIHIPQALGIHGASELFGSAANLLQTASVMPFPVFVNGQDYNGSPDPLSTSILKRATHAHFLPLVLVLKQAMFVPLGPVPTKVMLSLANAGAVRRDQVLDGVPHPSGANAERVNYFLGRKPRHQLSRKTDPAKLDAALALLTSSVMAWRPNA